MKIGSIIFAAAILVLAYFMLQEDYNSPPIIDPHLQQYVSEWKKDLDKEQISYLERFNQIDEISLYDGPEYGLSDIRKVKINKKLLGSEWLIRQTVYHELGHSVFDLRHDENESIMYAKDLGEEFYKSNWKRLLGIYIEKCKK